MLKYQITFVTCGKILQIFCINYSILNHFGDIDSIMFAFCLIFYGICRREIGTCNFLPLQHKKPVHNVALTIFPKRAQQQTAYH